MRGPSSEKIPVCLALNVSNLKLALGSSLRDGSQGWTVPGAGPALPLGEAPSSSGQGSPSGRKGAPAASLPSTGHCSPPGAEGGWDSPFEALCSFGNSVMTWHLVEARARVPRSWHPQLVGGD